MGTDLEECVGGGLETDLGLGVRDLETDGGFCLPREDLAVVSGGVFVGAIFALDLGFMGLVSFLIDF